MDQLFSASARLVILAMFVRKLHVQMFPAFMVEFAWIKAVLSSVTVLTASLESFVLTLLAHRNRASMMENVLIRTTATRIASADMDSTENFAKKHLARQNLVFMKAHVTSLEVPTPALALKVSLGTSAIKHLARI